MIVLGKHIPDSKIQAVKETRGILSPAHVAARVGLTTAQVREVRKILDEQGESDFSVKPAAPAAPKKPSAKEQVLRMFAELYTRQLPKYVADETGLAKGVVKELFSTLKSDGLLHMFDNGMYCLSYAGINEVKRIGGIKLNPKVVARAEDILKASTSDTKVVISEKPEFKAPGSLEVEPAAFEVKATPPPAEDPVPNIEKAPEHMEEQPNEPIVSYLDELLQDQSIDDELAALDSKFMPAINEPDVKLKILARLQEKTGGKIAEHLNEISEIVKLAIKDAA